MVTPEVEIELKDGTILRNCAIFKGNNAEGFMVLTDKGEIKGEFQVMPWGNNFRVVNFQNEFLNGHIGVTNIKSWRFTTE